MPTFVRKPWFWLAVQVLVFGTFLGFLGKLYPNVQPDTASYAEFPFSPIAETLNHNRTFGYPVFLKCESLLAPSYKAVPLCHYGAHCAAVFLFYISLQHFLRSPWARLVVASSLLYSNVVIRYTPTVTADAFGSSLAIITMSLLLMAVTRPRGVLLWGCLTLSLFATYQTRPVYLFLPLLAPFLGMSLAALVGRRRDEKRDQRRMGLALCAAGILPLLAFCLVRWTVVGQFALVSFGGHNFAGLVGQFLSEEQVGRLPSELRPLARAALERQRKIFPGEPVWAGENPLSYTVIESRWDASTWKIYVPAAQQLYDGDKQRINSRLSELAIAMVRERPLFYAVWIAKAFCQGARLIVAEIVLNPVYLLLLFCLAAAHARHVAQRLRARVELPDLDAEYFTTVNSLLLIAVSFAAAKLLLVIVTSPPQGRFMDAAGVFLPTVIAAALANRVERCVLYRREAACGEGGG